MKKRHPCTSWFRVQPPLQPRGSCLQTPTFEASQPPAPAPCTVPAPAPLPSSTLKESSSNLCSSTQPQASPSLTSPCSRQKTRLRAILPLHAHNLPRQPSLAGLEQPTSPYPRPATHYPQSLIYSVFCSHRWVTCDCHTSTSPAQRPPPGWLRSCARAPSSPPDSHRQGGFTRQEPGKPVSSPLRRQRPLSSLSPSARQAAARLRPSRQPVLLPLLLALRRSMSAREQLSKAHAHLRPPGSLCRHLRPCPERQEKAASPLGQPRARMRAGGGITATEPLRGFAKLSTQTPRLFTPGTRYAHPAN